MAIRSELRVSVTPGDVQAVLPALVHDTRTAIDGVWSHFGELNDTTVFQLGYSVAWVG